ncbi:hypothetical protein BXO88_11005 [Oribacterium sp. C9]|uniref:hypothetical protein n=1 Tax=Oribacterium sp. C9 TaxID=1943579 RepID=UPI000990107A|nr:hypothetical protein [Oribacterium sp. C9]OON85777.1 hypothetical protein BXO88_11005 [Oribacterium sp. C9]
MFKITKDMLDDRIAEATIIDTDNTYREFLKSSWSRFTSSTTIPDFEKFGNSHLSAMMSYFVAKQHKAAVA